MSVCTSGAQAVSSFTRCGNMPLPGNLSFWRVAEERLAMLRDQGMSVCTSDPILKIGNFDNIFLEDDPDTKRLKWYQSRVACAQPRSLFAERQQLSIFFRYGGSSVLTIRVLYNDLMFWYALYLRREVDYACANINA